MTAELIIFLPLGYLLLVSYWLWRTDVLEHRLPNKFTFPGIALSLISVVVASVIESNYWTLVLALGQSLLIFGVGTLLSIKGWLGMGDNKLILAFSLPLGWLEPQLVLIGLAIALVVANLRVLVGYLVTRNLGSTIALGPYLLVGFLLSFGYWAIPAVV